MTVECDAFWGDEWGGLWGDACPEAAGWLGQLMPPGIALDVCTDDMQKLLHAAGDEFERIYFNAAEILRMIDPRETGFLREDWERVTKSSTPHATIVDTGGQSSDLYLQIAASYGYTDVTFGHVEIWTCVSVCTAPIFSEQWNLVIIVEGTSLGASIDTQFETHLMDKKLRGTLFRFDLT